MGCYSHILLKSALESQEGPPQELVRHRILQIREEKIFKSAVSGRVNVIKLI